jgi:hypothetical protein
MFIHKNAHIETENRYKTHYSPDGRGRILGRVEGHLGNEVSVPTANVSL